MTSSCGSSRRFAGAGNSYSAPPVGQRNEVEHAYTGESAENQKLVTQLDHQVDQPKTASRPTLDVLSVGSDDPFIASTTPEPVSDLAPEMLETSHDSQPRSFPEAAALTDNQSVVLTGAEAPLPNAAPHLVPASELRPHVVQASQPQTATQTVSSTAPAIQCPQCQPNAVCPHTPLPIQFPYTPPQQPEIVGDEYICDGGDRDTKVYHHENERHGLHTEDTIGEWIDEAGEVQVRASSRVCVYAPRFGSVRSASAPQIDIDVDGPAGNHDKVVAVGVDTHLAIDEKVHTDEALAMLMRSRASGINHNVTDSSVHQNQAVHRNVKLLNAFQEIQFLKEGRFDSVNGAVIRDAIAAANDWTGDLGVVIYGNNQGGQEVQARIFAQDYTVAEDHSKAGDLAIVKAVDKTTAKSGDELTFTIRFDNIGDRPLTGIRIVDNLSPRLIFIEGSVDSDLDGKVNIEENGKGSQLLSFTFDAPLKGHTGGWVSFKCRVR